MAIPERRFCNLAFESVDGKAPDTISGVAITYGDTAEMMFGKEIVEPGAFGDVSKLDLVLNMQHDRTRPLARTGGGGLTLDDTSERLEVKADLPDTNDGRDAKQLVERRILRGLSIEMLVTKSQTVDGVRRISAARLVGIGLVDKPAFPKSVLAAEKTERRRVWI